MFNPVYKIENGKIEMKKRIEKRESLLKNEIF